MMIAPACAQKVVIKEPPKSCPDGMLFVADAYCIDKKESPLVTYTEAKELCFNRGKILCPESEWTRVCSSPEMEGMTDNWEWADGQDDEGNRRILGEGGCNSHNYSYPGANFSYRCCIK